ncbi:PREDICTED: nuclear factor interleukin-3-regulated protein [Chinchilla lanigera]|uniref:nuclear factor interleukin-3-regulated protein n=1 Tax=Chinchilla lanigera TaxID=34839 RepID=UPI00069823F9|nr:PREDICTED: nuclear factor interleukin-3-regulated protein [Chinchilla lanigera]
MRPPWLGARGCASSTPFLCALLGGAAAPWDLPQAPGGDSPGRKAASCSLGLPKSPSGRLWCLPCRGAAGRSSAGGGDPAADSAFLVSPSWSPRDLPEISDEAEPLTCSLTSAGAQAAMDVGLLGLPDAPRAPRKTLWGSRGRGPAVRRQREFMPEEKKDTLYWERRRKNNEAAKRSREKRRLNDVAIEGRLAALLEENALLRAELRALKLRLGLLPPLGGPQTLPLPAVLWEPPWAEEAHSEAEALSPLPGSHCRLLSPCSLESGTAGCRGCLVARGWTGLAASPGFSREPAAPAPKGVDTGLQAARPAAFLRRHLLDGHARPRLELRSCWGLCSPVSPGCQASGPSEVFLTPSADPTVISPGVTCPTPGDSPEMVAQPSLPHKLRIKSQAPGRVW